MRHDLHLGGHQPVEVRAVRPASRAVGAQCTVPPAADPAALFEAGQSWIDRGETATGDRGDLRTVQRGVGTEQDTEHGQLVAVRPGPGHVAQGREPRADSGITRARACQGPSR
jgi:hypothetical protein